MPAYISVFDIFTLHPSILKVTVTKFQRGSLRSSATREVSQGHNLDYPIWRDTNTSASSRISGSTSAELCEGA